MKKAALALVGLACISVTWRSSIDAMEQRHVDSPAQKALGEELRLAYANAQTMEARRAVYLRAIDEGVIPKRGSIAVVDHIFGFDDKAAPGRWILENHPWKETETKERVSPPQWGSLRVADLGSPAQGTSSSHLYLVAAPHGLDLIVSELCNCQYAPRWKTLWRPPATASKPYLARPKDATSSARPTLVAELKTAYQTPTFQTDRRSVVLRVIDEGLLREGTPVSVVDELFGTSCANETHGVCEVQLMRGVPGSWRLDVSLDGEGEMGRVVCYSFSNYHPKAP